MTIALKRANGDILWFDAVTNFGESYSSTVTKHPIASGGFVSDHIIVDNNVYQISGVLSDADFNLNRPVEYKSTGAGDGSGTRKQYVNNTTTEPSVVINDSGVKQFGLPEIVARFRQDVIPSVEVVPQSKDKLAEAVKNDLIAMRNGKELFTILEFEGSVLVGSPIENCVFTSLSFKADANTGYGLFPEMTIEQVTFTNVESVKVQIKTAQQNKGRQTAVTKQRPTVEGDDAANGPTNQSKTNDSWMLQGKTKIEAQGATQ
jgi:hypothetical protein